MEERRGELAELEKESLIYNLLGMKEREKNWKMDYIRKWKSFRKTSQGVILTTLTSWEREVEIGLELIAEDIVRIKMNPEGFKEKRSPMLVTTDFSEVAFSLMEKLEAISLSTEKIRVEISREPWQITIRNAEGKIFFQEGVNIINVVGDYVQPPLGYDYAPGSGAYRVRETVDLLPEERIYGLGEKFSPLNKRGEEIISWTGDALGVFTPLSYKNIPFFLSSRGYGLFIHSSYRIHYDLGSQSFISYSFIIDDAQLDYFVIYGPSFKEILRSYCNLTGYAPLPPLWSFGLWMSRFGYRNRQELEEVARRLREEDIPCDVLHIDPYWLGENGNYWCRLEWDEKNFPEPEKMLADLRKMGFRVCLWENSYVPEGSKMFEEGKAKGYFVKRTDGSVRLIPNWAGGIKRLAVVDFTNSEAVKWYQEIHERLLNMGVAVFKTDFGEWAPVDGVYHEGSGEEIHNIYPLLYNRAVFEITNKFTGGKGVVWGRSAYAGSQRYPVHWGGDCHPTFSHMACQLRGGLSFGLSGVPFYSHDIGGFAGESNPILYVRWAQFGLFSSHSRCHGTTPREPWHFGKEATDIFRKYVKLRYRLLPYIYSCAKISTLTGLPVMRPLVLEYQDDPRVSNLDSEYLFGESFLVAPVFSEEEREVYLPAGKWIDYWAGKTYQGPVDLRVKAPLDTLPIFIKGGAIIPMAPEMSYTGEKPWDPLTLKIHPAGESRFTIYREDEPPIPVVCREEKEKLIISLGEATLNWEIIIYGISAPGKLTLNGKEVTGKFKEGKLEVNFTSSGACELIVWK